MKSTTLNKICQLIEGEGSLGKFINLSSVIAPSIVMGRGGELLTSFRVAGIPFETVDDQDVDVAVDQLNTLYRSISRSEIAIQVHRLRRPLVDELSASTEPGFARNLSMAYNTKIGHESLMATELYITLIMKKRSFTPKGTKRSIEEIKVDLHDQIDEFEKISGQFERSLAKFKPQRLGEFTKNDVEFSEQLSLYNFILSGEWQPVRIPNKPLHAALVPSQIFIGADTLEVQNVNKKHFVQCLELKDYTQTSFAGILNGLLYPDLTALKPYVFVETQTFAFLNKQEGLKTLKMQQKHLLAAEDAAEGQIAAINIAMDGLADGQFAIGEYSYTIAVYADSVELVKKNTADAAKKLQDEGFLPFVSTTALAAAFFSQLPCAFAYRPRISKITSENFAHLAPLHNFYAGKRNGNPWGEALALLKTPSDQPFYFNFHISDFNKNEFDSKRLGNTVVIGTSGSGKTVLLNFLLAMAQKYRTPNYDMTTVYFDKDCGAEIAVRAMGGGYLKVENGIPTGFNPFQLENTPENIQFLNTFVKEILKQDGQIISTSEDLALTAAIKSVMEMPRQMRRMALVPQFLTEGLTKEERQNSLSKRLSRWIGNGDLAWVFDNPEDTLDFSKYSNFGIDGTDFLDNKEVRTPIALYLLHRMEQVIDGRRFIFVMDEFWKWLLDDAFRDFAFNKLKVIRKQNGLGVFATQSPSDVINSPIAKAVIEQSATQIFLPNPRADRTDYVDGFKVTDAEFEIIRRLPEGSRTMLIKQDNQSAICRLDLGWLPPALKILSGSTENIELMHHLIEKNGEQPECWLKEFLA